MSRWIRMQVSVFDHAIFADEPFSKRDAWGWMIARAAWRETSHRIGANMHVVEVGSFYTTLRELQTNWHWKSDTKVRSFLRLLEAENMILQKSNAGKTQITICNYSEYQDIERTNNARKTQRKRTKDTSTPITSLQSVINNTPTGQKADPFRDALAPFMSKEILDDFLTVRKKKKGASTLTAAREFWKNAKACGLTLDQAATIAIDRNWITVKPDWISNGRDGRSSGKPQTAFDAYNEIAKLKGWNDEPRGIQSSGENAELFSETELIGHSGPTLDL